MLADLDLLLIAVFCRADDLLTRGVKNARRIVTDAEVVTVCVAQAMMGITSDQRFLNAARKQLSHLFPVLPKRPGYLKRCLLAAPPSNTALGGREPARSSSDRSVSPNGNSYRPGRSTCPETQKSRVAVEPSVPIVAYSEPRSRTTSSTLKSVSTSFTTVGLPNSPTSTGNGGLLRGSPR